MSDLLKRRIVLKKWIISKDDHSSSEKKSQGRNSEFKREDPKDYIPQLNADLVVRLAIFREFMGGAQRLLTAVTFNRCIHWRGRLAIGMFFPDLVPS
jgi:hypothetical protein